MRAPIMYSPLTNLAPQTRLTSLLAIAAVGLTLPLAGPATAQNSPGSFSLPTATPTPTPAPQGPVDIRDGVVIGPRTIPAERPQATPTPAPTPAPPPTQTQPPASATPSATGSRANAPSRTAPASSAPTRQADSQPPAPSRSNPSSQEPTQNNAGDEQFEGPTIDDDGFYPVENIDTDTVSPQADRAQSVTRAIGESDGFLSTATRFQALIGLAVLLALLGGLGWWFWRKRARAQADTGLIAAPVLAAGVREAMPRSSGGNTPHPRAPEPNKPAPPISPAPHYDLRLHIVSATRSLMSFTVEYRLDIANRSDRALRDFAISAQLVCARQSQQGVATDFSEPLELVERIGPHQTSTVLGRVQLPLSRISLMMQGTKPLFVPLLHLKIEASGDAPKLRSYVIGAPSAASAARLTPIALDTTPGGIPGLRAQEIKDHPAKADA